MSNNFDLKEIMNMFLENQKWADLSVTIEDIVNDNKRLVAEISNYDSKSSIALVSSLLTIPEYQTQCIRLEVLAILVALYSDGKRKPYIKEIKKWFKEIGKSKCCIGEDPAEDVFVSNINDHKNGNLRIINGIWESAGFYTQAVFDVISTIPKKSKIYPLVESYIKILQISEYICNKSELSRYQLGSEERHNEITQSNIPHRQKLIERTVISKNDLEDLNIKISEIEPFISTANNKKNNQKQSLVNSEFHYSPLIINVDDSITVLLPTSLSIAARNYVISQIIKNNYEESFDEMMAQYYSNIISDTQLVGELFNAPVIWKSLDNCKVSTVGLEIDEGYFFSFNFIQLSINTYLDGGFIEAYSGDKQLKEEIKENYTNTIKYFSKREGFKKGVIISVGCGWGKGFILKESVISDDNWYILHISISDLFILNKIFDMSPKYLLRVLEGEKKLNNLGISFLNPNGILNFIGWIKENKEKYLPDSIILSEDFNGKTSINPPINLLRDIRNKVLLSHDEHMILDHNGIWHKSAHSLPYTFFEYESEKKLYISLDDAKEKNVSFVYEGMNNYWFYLILSDRNDLGLLQGFIQILEEWLHRICNYFESYNQIDEGFIYSLEIKVSNSIDYFTFKEADVKNIENYISIERKNESEIMINIQNDFLYSFRLSNNIGEKTLVSYIYRALCIQTNTVYNPRIISSIVKNDNARSFHMFHTKSYLDYTQDSLPKKILYLDGIDFATIKISLIENAPSSVIRTIKKKDNCTKFLNQFVEKLLKRIYCKLHNYSKKEVIVKLLGYHEKATVDKNQWEKTSHSILSLHDEEQGVNRFIENVSKYSHMLVATRILLEIAICECSTNSKHSISDIELNELLTYCSMVSFYGGMSDAIKYNIMKPEIKISITEDILFYSEFEDEIVNPLLFNASKEKLLDGLIDQTKNYEKPEFIESVVDLFPQEFLNIWKIETGFEVDNGRKIIDLIEDYGIKQNQFYFEISKKDLVSLLEDNKIDKNEILSFINLFTLSGRKRWEKVPHGFDLKDIYPWKYGRRLSFVCKPILSQNDVDDNLIIAPNTLRTSFTYFLVNTFKGTFDQSFFTSNEMKNKWWGKASEGHTFNKKVFDFFKDNGWNALENITIHEVLKIKNDFDWGDVDVLAWKDNNILIIECKDLSFARNYSEIAAMLSQFQGRTNEQKKDKLRKHLDRVDILLKNKEKVESFTGINNAKIKSCLICSKLVPMQYSKIEPLQNTFVGTMVDVLAKVVDSSQ